MGFGSRIPDWVEPAIEGNLSKVRKMEPSLVDSEIIVLSASGMNIDQAEEALLELEVPEDYLVYETFWVRQAAPSDKPYIAVAIYRRK